MSSLSHFNLPFQPLFTPRPILPPILRPIPSLQMRWFQSEDSLRTQSKEESRRLRFLLSRNSSTRLRLPLEGSLDGILAASQDGNKRGTLTTLLSS